MDKRYLIYKCSAGLQRRPISWLTACDQREAHEALRWLQKHHEENADFKLAEGEFFEILDESHIPQEEWQSAMAQLKMRK
jgi:hypothetical protein